MNTYCIFRIMPNGTFQCIEELVSLEEAQRKLLVLEAEHPGDYVAFNKASGKPVHGTVWSNYVC